MATRDQGTAGLVAENAQLRARNADLAAEITALRAQLSAAEETRNTASRAFCRTSSGDLLSELERLRAENALLNERNVQFEARLLHSELSSGVEVAPPSCSKCGTACVVCSSSEIEEQVTLPTELLLMIAEYFQPGTRNLLNLARASRNLYELLLPRLYERLKVPDIFTPFKHIRRSLRKTSLKSGLVHVRALDLVTPGDWFQRCGLIWACQNLVELRIEFSNDHKELLDLTLELVPRLEKLTVWAGKALPQDLSERELYLPNLRELSLEGTPSFELIEFLAENLPDLERVHIAFDDELWGLDALDSVFVAKIKSYRLEYDNIPQLRGLESFQPESLEFSHHLYEGYDFVANMASLRKIVVGNLRSCDLLHEGLPPNLEIFDIKLLLLDIASREDLAVLRGVLRKRDVSKWKVHHYDCEEEVRRWPDPQVYLYAQELRMWQEEVPGFVGGISKEMRARIEDLETSLHG